LQTRLDVARSRGFSRFVGRADEMATLEAALDRIIEGQGRVVGVVGEAGVGKSRLCFEFAERCRARGIPIAEAHAVAHGKMIPFLPLLELLRGYFQISDRDSEENARRKIAGTLVLLDREFEEALPLMFEFLGVPDPKRPARRMDPEARERELFGIVRRIIRARSSREPTVMLIEDLHWMDGGSEAFLEHAVETVAGTRTLLLVNFRPEYHAGWMQKSYYHQLPLLPLGSEAIRELLQDLLGRDPSLAVLGDLIQERTSGNPFFIEEVVQSLAEAGSLEGTRGAYRLVERVQQVAVPATVQAVLAARIDRLAEREKQVLQTASVVGKKFSQSVLRQIAELPELDLADTLHRLMGAEFVYEESLYPELQYAFKHPLTQEVAYQSQLSDRRARVHAAVARAIEELGPEKLDEQAALIAHHWQAAGDSLEAARWHRRAAMWATVRAPAEAVRHWRKVRSLLEEVSESQRTIRWRAVACSQLLNLGWRQGVPEEEAALLFEEGKQLAEKNRDPGMLSLLNIGYANVRGGAGDCEAWVRYASEALQLAEQTGSEALQVAALTALAPAFQNIGDYPHAVEITERALALTQADPTLAENLMDFSPHIFLTAMRGLWLACLGRVPEGAEKLERGVRLAREHNDLILQAWASGWLAVLADCSGELAGARAHARAGVELAERVGSAQIRVETYRLLGQAALLEEDWEEAAQVLGHALAVAREMRSGRSTEPNTLAMLALAHAGEGKVSLARSTAEEGIALAQRRRTVGWEATAQLNLARVLLTAGAPDDHSTIEHALDRAVECVHASGAQIYLPQIHSERAKLARLKGDAATHEAELREAQRLFSEMGATGHAERLAGELDSLG
jgi:adenylate cyclase